MKPATDPLERFLDSMGIPYGKLLDDLPQSPSEGDVFVLIPKREAFTSPDKAWVRKCRCHHGCRMFVAFSPENYQEHRRREFFGTHADALNFVTTGGFQ